MVCQRCGVAVVQNFAFKWLHTDSIPAEIPLHDALPIERVSFMEAVSEYTSVSKAASDMLVHHAAIHPESGCEFADRLRKAIGS